MAVYAIGDVQGCCIALEELLEQVQFDAARDRLWLTGDLVNRGRHSLDTLRLVRRLGDSAVTVLGNHDLHLLAIHEGIRKLRDGDTLQEILRAPDCDELLHWLRHRPLLHCEKKLHGGEYKKAMMTHAGIYPGWRARDARRYAGEVETLLRGDDYPKLLRHMYGSTPTRWDAPMGKWRRARFIINVFTRMRYCNHRAALNFTHKGLPADSPKRLMPWFMHPKMKLKRWHIVFGHWSALGFFTRRNVTGLDSGCAWGGVLTAVRLDGEHAGRSWQVRCDG